MIEVGIDKIGFYTSNYYLDVVDLAKARNVDPNKYLIGIGQKKQAVINPTQDAVTMAANASINFLTEQDKQDIKMIIFGTETGVDNSKSAAVYLQNLLGINKSSKAFEIKQACYGATAGLQIACDYVRLHPDDKVLVVGSDIARYGIKTPGEITQGGGAVSMLVTANPEIIAINETSTFYSEDIMDFWRPIYSRNALVDGHYSNEIYLQFFQKTYHEYLQQTGKKIDDFAALLFHLPFTKMGIKGLKSILDEDSDEYKRLLEHFENARNFNANVGNLYTGSLYLSFLSLIANDHGLKTGDLIGFFSYGSGAQGEFFSGNIKNIDNDKYRLPIENMLSKRKKLSVAEYEKIYEITLPNDNSDFEFDISDDKARFVLTGRKNGHLVYKEQPDRML